MEISLAQIGVVMPSGWDIHLAFASTRPWAERRSQEARYAARMSA